MLIETPSEFVRSTAAEGVGDGVHGTKKRRSRKPVCGGLLDGTSDLALTLEYANSANCTVRAVEYGCSNGTIKAVRVGNQWRIPRAWAIRNLGLAED